ncbi:hypothetical protein MHBO_002413 [Bonamia ostreae]|uniref:ATP synthase F0 subunit 8 n=1 Tax=Bonamia ostreae TaxID=126728 RepID=A0ABV2AM82_9EUKA
MYTFPIWIILSLSLSFFPFVGENYGCTHHALREPVVWFTALFSAIFCCLPRLLLNFFRRYNRPSHLDIAIEIDDIDAEKIDLESSELTINQNITDFEMQITKKDKTKGYDDYYRNSEKNSWRDFVKSRLLEPIVKVN